LWIYFTIDDDSYCTLQSVRRWERPRLLE